MKCRQCGTEIVDKALICYRCGTAVTEAVHKPAELQKPKRPTIVYVVFAIFVVVALVVLLLRSQLF
jgi:predicted amidophosphoribosyltransferase